MNVNWKFIIFYRFIASPIKYLPLVNNKNKMESVFRLNIFGISLAPDLQVNITKKNKFTVFSLAAVRMEMK